RNGLAGSLRPPAGGVELGGVDVPPVGAAKRCRLGVGRAYQVPRPFGDMSVFENVLVGAASGGGRRGRQVYERSAEVLALCGLTELANRRADTLGLLHRKRLQPARPPPAPPTALLPRRVGRPLAPVGAGHAPAPAPA